MLPLNTAVTCLLATLAAGAPPTNKPSDDSYYRVDIFNGTHHSVHYYPTSATTDAPALRELERAENESLQAVELQQLRHQYILDEQAMQAHRQAVQMQLYGNSTTTTFKENNSTSSFTPYTSLSSSPLTVGGPNVLSGFRGGPFGGTTNSLGGTIGTPLITTPTGTSTPMLNPDVLPGATSNLPITPVPGASVPGVTSNLPVSMGTGFTPFGTTGFGGVPVGNGFLPGLGNSVGFSNPLGMGVGLGASNVGFFNPPLTPFTNPYFSLYGYSNSVGTERTTTSNQSLANGIGDEGRLKAALAPVIARQATAEYQAMVEKNFRDAQAAVARQSHPEVTVTLKDGAFKRGRLVRETNDFVVIRSGDEEEYVRFSEISRMTKKLAPSADRTASRR